MRFLIQRVREASVNVNGCVIGRIEKGFVVLVGVNQTDTVRTAEKMVKKRIGLRIFEDEDGKMNLSVKDIGGSILAVSQFTLLGDARKGRRPSFASAAPPQEARRLYEKVIELIKNEGIDVEEGVFQAEMMVKIDNDGPVTILLDSGRKF